MIMTLKFLPWVSPQGRPPREPWIKFVEAALSSWSLVRGQGLSTPLGASLELGKNIRLGKRSLVNPSPSFVEVA